MALMFCTGLAASCSKNGSPEVSSDVAGTEEISSPAESETLAETAEETLPAYATEEGATFSAEGFSSVTDGGFVFRSELLLNFDEPAGGGNFNRMTFVYSSDGPLKLRVSYSVGGVSATEIYYLETGIRASFSGLISTYLSGGEGADITSVGVTPLYGKTTFRLFSLTTEKIDVIGKQGFFIENSRFKVGIRLSWGGGINCIEDKNCPVEGLSNLINSHDTGRLIQQSYYGTAGNSKYTPGNYNGQKWAYNPVQGGDQYGNPSRLIDVETGDGWVRVKSQPQDWSKNNCLTPSYMENVYTLCDGYIRVDNRFVDFSGWEHRYAHQELPAFYTVSYLDRFVYYGGADGWTGANLTVKDGLGFWGDPNYSASCRFTMKKGNEETWCAWTSSSEDYGIGLYVPDIDQFFAGRFSYNGSKSASDAATNYVAPLLTLKLKSFQPVEYSYLITTGTVEQIRDVFYENRDFADNSPLTRISQSMR
ncbi:MAG: hypothetical protein ILO42_04325 [Clostridia bacterium]|nr:hypothetical protein [Clostridia bacterium]